MVAVVPEEPISDEQPVTNEIASPRELALEQEVRSLKTRVSELESIIARLTSPQGGNVAIEDPASKAETSKQKPKKEKCDSPVPPAKDGWKLVTKRPKSGTFAAAAATQPLVESTPAPKKQVAKRPPMNNTQVLNILAGKPVKNQGLSWIFIKNITKVRYTVLKNLLASCAIDPYWVKHISYGADNTVELLVFKEKVEPITQALLNKNKDLQISYSETKQLDVKSAKQLIARLQRNIDKIPRNMHVTRKTITKRLEVAQATLAELNTGTSGNQMDVDKSGAPGSPSGSQAIHE